MSKKLLILFSLFCFSFMPWHLGKDKEQFVEIRGKKQYYVIKGTGEPLVVFITGLGPTMDDFSGLQNRIAKKTKTLCYNRAGVGKSESYNNERSLENISAELKELLDKVGIDKSVILVGHSRGGLILRYFIDKYPGKVCGAVLIDPALPELKPMRRALRTTEEKIEFDKYYNSFITDSTKYSAIIRNEFRNFYTTDSVSVANKGFINTIPTTIIGSVKATKDKYGKEDNTIKTELFNDYVKKFPQIKLVLTNKSGHFIHDEEPKLISDEILLVIKKIKG
ncbi:MAG: alpha/beta hydrolase [Bacteroidia bacterium]|nr:alpha/beta hydrolase [Bacteroidia bacterium]